MKYIKSFKIFESIKDEPLSDKEKIHYDKLKSRRDNGFKLSWKQNLKMMDYYHRVVRTTLNKNNK